MYRYVSEGCIILYSSEYIVEVAKEDAFCPKAVTAEEVDR
jgi:hypothetical protein